MANKRIVMGMTFDENRVPDFGSIYDVCLRHNGVNDYGLNAADVSKLSQITNAAPGSTALCDDTGDIYRLTKTGWVKFGGGAANQSAANTNSLNLSPMNIDRSAMLGTDDLNVRDDDEELM